MFIRTIKFQIEREGEWLRGYYVGEDENSNNSCFLDSNYQPITTMVWDYKVDFKNNISINIPEIIDKQ